MSFCNNNCNNNNNNNCLFGCNNSYKKSKKDWGAYEVL